MSKQEVAINYDNSSDALFRAWISAWDTALLAVGLTAVTVTGQVDFATVLKPSAGSQQRGFRVYRWNDGGTEIYLRVYWGSGGSGALQPHVWLWCGARYDDANSGAMYGLDQAGQYTLPITTANAALGTTLTRFCKSGAAFAISINESQVGSSPRQYVFLADRTRDNSGAVTNEGFLNAAYCQDTNLSRAGTGGAYFVEIVRFLRAGASWREALTAAYPAVGAGTTTWSAELRLCAAQICMPWGRPWGMLSGLLVSPGDVAAGKTFDATIWGSSHTYRQANCSGDGGNFLSRVCHIWE